VKKTYLHLKRKKIITFNNKDKNKEKKKKRKGEHKLNKIPLSWLQSALSSTSGNPMGTSIQR